LKIALDALPAKGTGTPTTPPASLSAQLSTLVTLSGYEAIVAAMITALFFYNVYDSTEVGRKINVGAGWRSALIIGGLSGLVNERIIAALRSLVG
jgi:hypothetical protein